MRVWPTLILLVLFAQHSASEDPTDIVRNIPKRYRKDWRLFCNVCNHFIWKVNDKLNKSIQEGDEHDFESRVGFRLDSNGKKHNLMQKSVDIGRSEIKITEVMDEDICSMMKVDAVLYNKKSKAKEAFRMLQKDQLYNKTRDQGFSKKRKYVAKANLYCAEVTQRYYDEVIEAFTSENLGKRDSFCRDYVDSRCPLITTLERVVFKPVVKKAKEVKGKTDPKKEDHNKTDAETDAAQFGNTSNETDVRETESQEEHEVTSQPQGGTDPEQPEQSLGKPKESSLESAEQEASNKHDEL